MTNSLSRCKTKRAFDVMSTEKEDQYEQYLEEEPVNAPAPNEEGNEDSDGIIIPYWRGVGSKWPDLARFTYNTLSIPVISTECERCFSSSKKTIETRWALNADSTEAHDIQVCAKIYPCSLLSRSHARFPFVVGASPRCCVTVPIELLYNRPWSAGPHLVAEVITLLSDRTPAVRPQ